MFRATFAVLLALASLRGLAADAPPAKAPEPPAKAPEAPKPEAPKEEKLAPGTYAHLKTAKGEIVFRLLDKEAPKTVANFVELAKGERPWKDAKGRWVAKPFYNGLTFHRVENGVMKLIQGGCPKGDGTGGPGYKFSDEIGPDLKFDKRGVVAMANSGRNTNGSQFFITASIAPLLDGGYTIFGEVARGLDVVTAICEMPSVEKDGLHIAKEPVAIQSVTFEEVKPEPAPPAAKGK